MRAWYWAGCELRACFVVTVAGVVRVIDAETLAVTDVDPADTMVERSETG